MKKTISIAVDTATGQLEYGSGASLSSALKKLYQLTAENTKIPWDQGKGAEAKAALAMEAGLFIRRELIGRFPELQDMRATDLKKVILEASDYSDPLGLIGTLSGTLVLQQCLTLFAYDYPELAALFTDFSSEAGLLDQTEQTRIVSIPAVQKYNAALDANGRPVGWAIASPAKTQDAPITLTDYIATPIVFSQATLSATQRDLMKEQGPAAIKAIAAYFVGMMVQLLTPANFNAYAAVAPPDATGVQTVPVAYSAYAKALSDWSCTDLDKISAIMTRNKVPRQNRGILLNTDYYAKLRGDPRLAWYYAASQASRQLTEQTLPEGLSGFMPYEAPYLPVNLPFFAFHKAGIILKNRLPQDLKNVLGGNTPVPGSVTVITSPDTKMSVALVQRVDLVGNYAEWRPECILGVSVGDNRGGLCGAQQ